MRASIIALALVFPVAALAVDNDAPPEPTPTTTVCTGGQVWDHDDGKCVDVEESRLDDDALYEAAREFAYAGQYEHALTALRAMENQHEDRVLTYLGFSLRKSGAPDRGMDYYRAALEANPDNLLARAYLGQAFVELGDIPRAEEQLVQIRARGGEDSWPERALMDAIETGAAFRY